MPNNPKNVESLTGLIERVTFFNEENGFAILKVKAKAHRDLVTVVGSLPSVCAGEWVTAQGIWVQDREYGLQFKAEMLTCTPPATIEGIKKYLGSGMVKGIGPVYAKKLVNKFREGSPIVPIFTSFGMNSPSTVKRRGEGSTTKRPKPKLI